MDTTSSVTASGKLCCCLMPRSKSVESITLLVFQLPATSMVIRLDGVHYRRGNNLGIPPDLACILGTDFGRLISDLRFLMILFHMLHSIHWSHM